MLNVYGYNNRQKNLDLLKDMTNEIERCKLSYQCENVLIGGDLNLVNDEWLDRSPPRGHTYSPNKTFQEFCHSNALQDAWRHYNGNKVQFSWFQPNGSHLSRLDYWLLSDPLLGLVSDVRMSAAPLTDHSVISLVLKPPEPQFHSKGYWKFNSELLSHDCYCTGVKQLIKEVMDMEDFSSYILKWEFCKYKIRQYSIAYSKNLKKSQRQEELQLIKELNATCNKPTLTDNDKQTLLTLQTKLDDMYARKAKGACVRSRARWIEEGEKNSAYFCRLEKTRQQRNEIRSLLIDNNLCKDQRVISKEILTFYSQLYTSKFSENETLTFFEGIKHHIPQITEVFRDTCDGELQIQEMDAVISKIKINKSPGVDGLTANFYKHFWPDVHHFLFHTFLEILNSHTLSPSMKQGIIILIPKPGKNSLVLDNRRPITLLTTDYKILTYVFANRLKTGIEQCVSESQSGFMKNRSIHNNIRLILDIIDYSDMIENEGFILFLDFFKAFDTLEHNFLFQSLEYFGFGNGFCNFVKTCYKDINSVVALPSGTTTHFPIQVGVRQGCPISPYLFILAVEMLAIHIKNYTELTALRVLDTDIVISQLADDTTIFLKDKHQIPVAIKGIEMFSKASGLCLNITKCELMPIKQCEELVINSIPVKREIKYLTNREESSLI